MKKKAERKKVNNMKYLKVRERGEWEELKKIDKKSDAQAVYRHIRETHTFLTDENHKWEDTDHSIVINRNDKSPRLHNLTPVWARLTDFWFAIQYKVE